MEVCNCCAKGDDHVVVQGVSGYGSTLRWLKVKFLGKGSYGFVYQMKPLDIGESKDYAVKSCADEYSSSLRKESEILKEFVFCKNVVQCHGNAVSVENGRRVYNIFLEYASAGTLLDLIDKYGGKIPESHARCYARMVVLGLIEIHQRSFVHCDLKPANILVFPSDDGQVLGRLKIADFGLARRARDLIEQREAEEGRQWLPVFPGTPVYMPPEIVSLINPVRINFSLDIWSLGCVVLQMITGKLPWQYRSRIDLVRKLVDTKISHPEIPCGVVSKEGVDFLTKCFARDPTQRWTATRLLSHPFLQPDLPSTSFLQHHARPNYSHLPNPNPNPMGYGMRC